VSSSQSSSFKYHPLVETDAIRVLVLHPAQYASAQLECSLEHRTLSRYKQELADHYIALSYVWGDPRDTRTVIVDGCPLEVTANLASALRDIRDEERVLRIWADAICINQDDEREKNQQVQQMGSIYSLAHHTVIYLGCPNKRTDLFFRSLQSLSRYSAKPTMNSSIARGQALIPTLSNILKTDILLRSWFTRIWVLQEFIFSRDPWVQCGKFRLQWNDFCKFSSMILEQSHPSAIKAKVLTDYADLKPIAKELVTSTLDLDLVSKTVVNKQLEYLQLARYKFQDYCRGTGKGHTLLDILTSRRGLGVSDARDMIYAHIALASDRTLGRTLFEVDYSKSASQVFTEVARYHIERHNNYSILSHVEDVDPSERRYGLPSWAPDWTSTILHDPHDTHQSRNSELPLPTFAFSALEDGQTQLVCKGKRLGRVTRTGYGIHLFSKGRSAIRTAWSKYSLHNESLNIVEPSTDGMAFKRAKEVYKILLRDWSEYSGLHILAELYASFASFPAGHRVNIDTLVNILTAFEKNEEHTDLMVHPMEWTYALPFDLARNQRQDFDIVSTDQELGGKRVCVKALKGRRLCLFKPVLSQKEVDVHSEVDPQCYSLDWDSRLALVPQETKAEPHWYSLDWDSRLALVPQETKEGDIICKLEGDPRTFVFRQREESILGGEGNETFALVGMCFVCRKFQQIDKRMQGLKGDLWERFVLQ
jgi:Heterokaryon incompatibility protein (HET)